MKRQSGGQLHRMRERRERRGILFVLPSLIGVSTFLLVPYIDVIRRSFTESVSGRFAGLKNYTEALTNSAFQLAAWNTFRFVIVCVPILVLLSLITAVLLQRQTMTQKLIKSSFLTPMAVPVASIVLLWRVLFDKSGMVNALLAAFGVQGSDWMNSGKAFGVLVFSYVWKNLGYDIVLWIAGLLSISNDIYEAAHVDGAGGFKTFWYITLPNLWPTLFIIVVLSLINSFKVFREAYLVAGDYPNESIYLLQHIFNNWFRDLALDKMAAGAVTLSIVLLVLILLFQRLWMREDA